MGFKAVYGSLREIFPQIDARVLKAVAIEHPKDVDAAVNDVLVEVIPYMSGRTISPLIQSEDSSLRVPSSGDAYGKPRVSLRHEQVVMEADVGPSEPWSVSSVDPNNIDHNSGVTHIDAKDLDGTLNESEDSLSYEANDSNSNDSLYRDTKRGKLTVSVYTGRKSDVVRLDYASPVKSDSLLHDDGGNEYCEQLHVTTESSELCSGTSRELGVEIGGERHKNPVMMPPLLENGLDSGSNDQYLSDIRAADDFGTNKQQYSSDIQASNKVDSSLDSTLLESLSNMVPPCFEKPSPVSLDWCLQTQQSHDIGSLDLSSKHYTSVGETSDLEDELTENYSSVTRSGQLCRVDLLEETIEVAKSNKKTLFSATESVISMMREVELKEKAAEQAQEEAAKGGLDILLNVEELKQMLARAKETNDMHAGEVYGEKAILATEVKELQSRLLSLADERDKSLQILDEMRLILEARLAVAEELKKAANQEKKEKEEHARNALVEQENLMKKVVQESVILQQEAEENSKLRDFLMDRGRVVDTLQGEISVICQDVMLLKEKFDDRVPLSKSLSSSQTSCILASSNSSQRSMTLDYDFAVSSLKDITSNSIADQGISDNAPSKSSPTPSVNASPKGRPEEEKEDADQKALLDDGWDILD